MSTLKTHNLQSSDSGSVNIALTPNAGMIVTGITTFTGAIDANGDLDVDGHAEFDNIRVAGVSTFSGVASGIQLNLQSAGGDIINVTSTAANSRSTIKFNTNGNDWEIGARGSTSNHPNNFYIFDNTATDYRMLINSAGAILFGTTVHSNAENLHIHTASSDKALIKLTNSTTGTGTGDGFEFGLNGSEQIEFVNKENTDMFFATNNAERLRITSGGQVNIGSSSGVLSQTTFKSQIETATNKLISFGAAEGSTYSDQGAALIFSRPQDGATKICGIYQHSNQSLGIGARDDFTVSTGGNAFYYSATEKFRITSYGDVYATNSAYNTYDTAATSVNTVVEANENRSGVYWLNFNGQKFRAYVKANWLQGRNWVLAAKYFDAQDMPSGSSLWTNDTYVNESDFNLYGGIMSKYRSWRYFSFNRLAMQMGNRIPPIMQFNSNQTLYGAFSGGYASNGGGVTANSTDPAMSGTSVAYHSMNNYAGPDFHDVGGSEDRIQSYGLNKWANNAANSTSGNNQGSENYYPQHRIEAGGSQSTEHSIDSESVKGFRMTIEDSHPNLTGVASLGRAGAWIGCPLDEGNSQQGSAGSNVGADSGFGMGGCSGNNARTWTSGYAEWNLGNSVVNCLPAYIWLSID